MSKKEKRKKSSNIGGYCNLIICDLLVLDRDTFGVEKMESSWETNLVESSNLTLAIITGTTKLVQSGEKGLHVVWMCKL